MTQNKKNNKDPLDDQSSNKTTCGLIMPISGMPDCPQDHWKNVQTILKSSIAMAGFESRLVSDADEIGIIHQRIVTNRHNDEDKIVVYNVGSKNPNVMF